jgi:hypothetical protein
MKASAQKTQRDSQSVDKRKINILGLRGMSNNLELAGIPNMTNIRELREEFHWKNAFDEPRKAILTHKCPWYNTFKPTCTEGLNKSGVRV